MKKFIIIAITLVLLFAVAQRVNTYEMQGTIMESGMVKDECGHLWEVDTNEFRKGDKVTIVFQERGNENRRTDDIVKELKK